MIHSKYYHFIFIGRMELMIMYNTYPPERQAAGGGASGPPPAVFSQHPALFPRRRKERLNYRLL